MMGAWIDFWNTVEVVTKYSYGVQNSQIQDS